MHPKRAKQAHITYPSSIVDPAILFVGAPNRFSDCLVKALASELSGAMTVKMPSFQAVLGEPARRWENIKLILLDEALYPSSCDHASALRDVFPWQVFAVTLNDSGLPGIDVATYREQGLISGLLPMNLRLDIWLSAVRLMMAGGEYVPPNLLQETGTIRVPPLETQVKAEKSVPTHSPAKPEDSSKICGLTMRELDVIRLAAKGHQNKIIAAELNLSEHTIKLHMHHIISKLGASNRTEASAIFHKHLQQSAI